MQADLLALTTEKIDYEAETKSAGGQSVIGSTTEDIVTDVRRYRRIALHCIARILSYCPLFCILIFHATLSIF